ncbi:MAG: TonB-dependent receptor [Pseudomonadales bacterium]|jgi:outer membrane receptor protein involved in Fe transport
MTNTRLPSRKASKALNRALNIQLKRKDLAIGISAAVASTAAFAQTEAPVAAQASAIEEVLVTARKRTESLQDVPISVQALSARDLENQGVSNFNDYALMLPNLSYQSAGPGLAQVYMRGASDGGDGNASGQHPSVAIYLDEQPVTAIGRNLDVHVYDIARVEALAGPQGTFFGASSQGGTLRIITNQPDTTQFEGGFDVSYANTKNGEDSYSVEGFVNIPLSESAAIRLVGWNKEDGGYIDNVYGERTYALFNPATPIVVEDNADRVEEDFNDLTNTGARAALKVDLNDSWTVTASAITQKQETEGVWFHDPENPNGQVGDLEIQRFNDDSSVDQFTQFSLVAEGDLGFATATYAGSLLDREVEYNNDYSDYADYYSTSWIQYYSCEYYGSAPVTSPCTSNNIMYEEDNQYDRSTHELRLVSNSEGPLNYSVGVYYEDSDHSYRQEWIQPGMAQGADFVQLDKANLWYLTDQVRNDKQTAVFGELSYDLTDKLTATMGLRYFDTESSLSGVSGYGVIAPGFPILNVDSSVSDSDVLKKFNVAYDLTDNVNLFVTWSEGYRPGGINRDETPVVERTYKADFLTNMEFGWKTSWADNTVRWNGAIYSMDWEDMQFTKFDSSFGSPVGLTLNVGEAEIQGLETDVTWVPVDGLTLSGAMAYNDASFAEDFVIGGNSSPSGTALPHVPDVKWNMSARYEFPMMGLDTHLQMAYANVDQSYNDIFKYAGGNTSMDQRSVQAGYDNLNLTAGVETDAWGVEAFINNATDERAEITRFTSSYDTSITTNRPRTIGVRFKMRFE